MSNLKKILIVVIFFFSLWTTFAQSKSVQGDWIMAKIKTENKTGEPFLIQQFTADGKLLLRDFEIGTWQVQDDGKLHLKSERYPIYNADFEMSFPTDNELLLKNNKTEVSLIRYDLKQLQTDSGYQNLIGTWKISGQDTNLLRLNNYGQFTLLTVGQNMSMTTKGTWLFLQKQKTFVLQGNPDILDKKNKILQQGKDFMEVVNLDIHYQLEKLPAPVVEHLSFKEEDLLKYNPDESKLPWRDFYAMKDYLTGVKTLRYDQSFYYPAVDAYITSETYTKIENKDKSIKFVNYYEPNEEAVKLSETIKGHLHNTYNYFFPQKDLNYYKVVDTQREITVEAGTFVCTLVDGMTGDTKYRYWMINDRPGVFAKIIIEHESKSDIFADSYQKYELTEIENK